MPDDRKTGVRHHCPTPSPKSTSVRRKLHFDSMIARQLVHIMKNCKIPRVKMLERNSNVELHVRFAPSGDKRHIFLQPDGKTLLVRSLQDFKRDSPKGTFWQFNTDGLHLHVDQTTVFETVLLPKLDLVLEGVDLLVLAFGEAGSGKSYTLSGVNSSYQERGLIPRTLEYLSGVKNDDNIKVELSISFVEFFQGKCLDLLAKHPTEIHLNEIHPKKIIHLKEALNLYFRGEVNRKFEKINHHCGFAVFSIYILRINNTLPDLCVWKSAIHFVDCPGFEGFGHLKKSILCSLFSNLGKFEIDKASRTAFASGLRGNWSHHLSGSSDLLKLIGKSFICGRVTLIGSIKPGEGNLKMTLSTLRFGCKIARLHFSQLCYNKAELPTQITRKLENELEELKKLHEKSQRMSSNVYDRKIVTQSQAEFIGRLVKSYLASDSVTEVSLLSTAEPILLLEEIRLQYTNEVDVLKLNFPIKSHESELVLEPESDELTLPVENCMKFKRTPSIVYNYSQAAPTQEAEPSEEGKSSTSSRNSVSAIKTQSTRKSTGGSRKSVSRKSTSRKSVSRKSMSRKSTSRKSLTRKSLSKKTKSNRKSSKKSGESKDSDGDQMEKFDEQFLERGHQDKHWLLNQFFIRNRVLAEEKNKIGASLMKARDDKLSKTKELNQLRALLANTRISLCEAHWRMSFADLSPTDQNFLSLAQERKSLLQLENDTKAKIREVCEELTILHAAYIEGLSNSSGFQDKVDQLFQDFCFELYGKVADPINASNFDRIIPRHTVLPSSTLASSSEIEFLKMQVTHLQKQTPVDFKF